MSQNGTPARGKSDNPGELQDRVDEAAVKLEQARATYRALKAEQVAIPEKLDQAGRAAEKRIAKALDAGELDNVKIPEVQKITERANVLPLMLWRAELNVLEAEQEYSEAQDALLALELEGTAAALEEAEKELRAAQEKVNRLAFDKRDFLERRRAVNPKDKHRAGRIQQLQDGGPRVAISGGNAPRVGLDGEQVGFSVPTG